MEEDVHFATNEQLRQLYVEIIDDNEWEPDEFFFVKLSLPDKEENEDIVLGNISITQVTIINDDGRSSVIYRLVICSLKIKKISFYCVSRNFDVAAETIYFHGFFLITILIIQINT